MNEKAPPGGEVRSDCEAEVSRELSDEDVEPSLEDADIQSNTVSRWSFSLHEMIAERFD